MPPGFLDAVARLCCEHDVLLLADEVATGFGRTGAMFACEHEGVGPDLMALGKGLTGGYLPLAATLASDAIYDAFSGDFAELKALYHGHSFTGNQLGCAAALTSLDLFEQDGLVAHVQESARYVARRLEDLARLPHVGEVRQCGLMVGIELVADRETKEPFDWQAASGARVCRRARELGMITRPLGDVVVFMPPLATARDDLEAMLAILHQAIADVG
jgi:adenosylmethionine-8-amino-7-oxononanoate aminotransferase